MLIVYVGLRLVEKEQNNVGVISRNNYNSANNLVVLVSEMKLEIKIEFT